MAAIHVKTDDFQKEVMESKIPVIVDFWAEWCGPCKMMGPVFEELSAEYEGKLKFVKVNTEEEPTLAGQFGIMSIPSLVVFNGGTEANRIMGFAPKDALKQKIDQALGDL